MTPQISSDDDLHAITQAQFLDALTRGESPEAIEQSVRRCSRKGFCPDVAVLEVGVAALQAAGVSQERPLSSADLVRRHLPEITFRNQRHLQERTTYALQAVSSMRAGVLPEILDDTYWWRTRDIVQYAVIAAVAYMRACADRAGEPLPHFADRVRDQLGLRR